RPATAKRVVARCAAPLLARIGTRSRHRPLKGFGTSIQGQIFQLRHAGNLFRKTGFRGVDFTFARSIESAIFTLGAAALDACSSRSSNEISA
ncbi:TPA: hypothetical protein ACYLK7_004965, partial [Burkholderia cenocepacia]